MTTIPKINNDAESRRIQRNMTDTQKKTKRETTKLESDNIETA